MNRPAFRFAPSPNGRLHLGHAYSALLNAEMARRSNGKFLVRIEDIDTIRCTQHLAEDALEDLHWLGLDWEQPVRTQSQHIADYKLALQRLDDMRLLYPCFCTRQDIARNANTNRRDPDQQTLYPGTCKSLSDSVRAERIASGKPYASRLDMVSAVRQAGPNLSFHEEGPLHSGTCRITPERWGDVVLARKDIGTSYHVAVVADDALQAVTHIVRGNDLFEATSIHRLLQALLDLPAPIYHHHALIDDGTGRKLSKSAKDRSLRSLREAGVTAAEIRAALGFQDETEALEFKSS
jgi:glutamyl-Q tRNA(Asp) synthetase